MDDLETLVVEMAAGVKLLTGMLGLTIALLPQADRVVVLKALAALQTEASPPDETDRSKIAATSASQAGQALTRMIEQFAAEIAATRNEKA